MRIVSGTHKSRIISVPKNLPVRPTTDFAKESLFNILNNHFDFSELQVLDLFSGTGNITYEFASRGSIEITTVDSNYDCIAFIKKTSNLFGFNNIQTIKSNVFSFLKQCTNSYDIIFADPPYDMEETILIPNTIFQKKLLKEKGWLIIEHSHDKNFSGNEHFSETRKYGNVNFSIFY